MRENLVGMLECIKWLKTSRKDRDLTVVPGSATFRKDGKAELTFSNLDLDEGESGGRTDHELPAVAQFFLTVLVYAHLWLCKSEREGDEVEIRGPRVLSPNTIFGMLREKRYVSWTTEEDVKDFIMSLSFDPLERGEWTDSMMVIEWKEYVQRFRLRMFLNSLVDIGAIETKEMFCYLRGTLSEETKTVTYQCSVTGAMRQEKEWQGHWPSVLEEI